MLGKHSIFHILVKDEVFVGGSDGRILLPGVIADLIVSDGLTRILSCVEGEDSESKSDVGVTYVVAYVSKRVADGADVVGC